MSYPSNYVLTTNNDGILNIPLSSLGYEEETLTINFIAPAIFSTTAKIIKFQNLITLQINPISLFTATANQPIIANNLIPNKYRPSTNIYSACVLAILGNRCLNYINVDDDGLIVIYKNLNAGLYSLLGNFSNGDTVSSDLISISWII